MKKGVVMSVVTKPRTADLERQVTFDFKDLDFPTFKKTLDTYGVVVGRGAFSVA
jgi:hypothetical protein